MSRLKAGILGGVLLVGGALVGWHFLKPHAPRSVILVTVDTLRADHLSFAGYERATSPRLDAFAKQGTWFQWAMSPCSYTLPSHASMMVGVDPSFHSVGLLNSYLPLEESETTLAEICRNAGMKTRAVVSNFILRRDRGLSQGFEVYDDVLPDKELVRGFYERRAAHAMDAALVQLAQLGDQPFFLWIHLQDPHGPYTPQASIDEPAASSKSATQDERILPAGNDQSGYRAIPGYQLVGQERAFEQYRARYDREIVATDRELGRLFDALEKNKLLERTLVAITADHGEALGEDDFFFAHSHSIGLDQVHVPLVIVGPDVRRGVSVREPVSNMDLFATILEFLDLPLPQVTHSRSLLSTLTSGAAVPSEPFFISSISQRGVVFQNEFLRTDRVSASDKKFWSVNPVTEGFFMPLGTEAWSLKDRKAVKIAARMELARPLEEFSTKAEAALRRMRPGIDQGTMDDEVHKALQGLGYAK